MRVVPASGPTAATWEELKDYVGFDAETVRLLRAFHPRVEPHLDDVVKHFYEHIARFPGASAVLSGPEQVERLRKSLRRFLDEMLLGPHDQAYFERRRRIGHVHVAVGLPERYVFGAMNRIRTELCELAVRGSSREEYLATCLSVGRITDLELAVMSSTYLEAHEARQLRGLQDLIVENLPVTVLCLDSRGRVTSATRPSARLFSESDAQGQHYERFLPPALVDAADLPSHMGRALATGNEITVPRVAFIDSDGEARQFRITLVPLEHERARVLLHLEELTDAIRTEQRLQQAQALANIGSLAAHLAHEIRNPLAAISATLQVIVGSLAEDDRRKRILGKVQQQVHRLDRLVSDLLGYARPARPELRTGRLVPVLKEAIAQSGVAVALDAGADPEVLLDPQYIQQVAVNMVHNARDALEGAGMSVDGALRIRVLDSGGFEVHDDGPGVPSEVRERLFEPFVTSKVKGTGLGLAISRKLVRGMGGDLVLLPQTPGTTFRVVLRLAERRTGSITVA